MIAPATFMVSLAQCLSTMALYARGHPARERVVDAAFARLLDLLYDVQYAEFSVLGHGIVYQGRVLEDLRSWDWGPRLAAAGIERIEIDADVTREAWETALEEMFKVLNGHGSSSGETRQMAATPVRFGSLRVMGGDKEAGGTGGAGVAGAAGKENDGVGDGAAAAAAAAEPEMEPMLTVSLDDEVAAVNWIHEDALTSDHLPMAEVEAVVGSLAIAMKSQQKMLLPLLMLKEFDEYTTTHACNVSVLAMGLAEALGCTRADIRAFGVAGLLHDIGKVKVPKEILTKPGRLTDEERAVMATHPEQGARILLEREKGLQMAAVVAYEHHVCIDGKGYPQFQFGRGCHYASRVVHVCDIYDALSTNRPYRKPWTSEQALQYLEERAGSEVEPAINHAFAAMVRASRVGKIPMPG